MAETEQMNLMRGNRLCLDFVNLPYVAGEPIARMTSWSEFVEFLAEKRIVSEDRGESLQNLPETDANASQNLLNKVERLGHGIRFAARALARNGRIHREWIEPVNEILRVTEGHDELVFDGNVWRLGFLAKEEGLDWLLAAIARSAAELIANGAQSGVRQCSNPNCQLLFCDDSRTGRWRWCSMALCGNRSKVAAFAKRHGAEKARAHHA